MKMVLPPLKALRAFESAARHESFTLAAHELAVTHGAISRQVAILEDHLGALLFERTHRQVRLTAAGSALRDEATASLLRIAAATARVRDRNQSTQLIRLNAPPAFSVRWLIARLSSFQREHPRIEVSLTSSVATPDFNEGLYDLAIRRLERPPRQWHSQPLFPEHSIAVAHSALTLAPPVERPIRQRGWETEFNRIIRQARLIRVAGEPRGWTAWASRWSVNLGKARYLEVEQTYLAVQAVMEGLGVALLPYSLVRSDIEKGTLTTPLGDRRIDDSRYYLIAAQAPRSGGPMDKLQAHLGREGRVVAREITARSAG